MVELNFDVVSRNVTAFDAVPLESAPLSNLFSKSQKWEFSKQIFFLYSLAPRRRMCYDSHSAYQRVLPWKNAKTPGVGLQRVPQQLMLHTHPWPCHFFLFFGVFGCFFVDLMTSSVGTYGNGSKTSSTENLHPSVLFDKKWGQLGIRCALKVVLYLWTVFICVFYSQPFLSQFVLVTSKFLGSYKFQ